MRLSVQLYTVRDHLSQDLKGTLAKLAEAGLEYVEFAGLYDKTAEEWKAMLDELGLKASGSHQGIDGLENDFDKVISDAKTIGIPYLFVPWIGEDQYKDGWDKFGARMNELGKKVKAAGLQLGYHNHAFEFPGGLEALYGASDKENVVAELDLAWVKIGGEDPAGYIAKYADRLPVVHLKDYDPTKDPQWQPAGEGVLDWDPIIEAALKAGVKYGAIELDQSAIDALEAVKKSIKFFKGKGLS